MDLKISTHTAAGLQCPDTEPIDVYLEHLQAGPLYNLQVVQAHQARSCPLFWTLQAEARIVAKLKSCVTLCRSSMAVCQEIEQKTAQEKLSPHLWSQLTPH